MDEQDLQTLAVRLESNPVDLPSCTQIADLVSTLPGPPHEERFSKLIPPIRRRCGFEPLWWPCHTMPAIIRAVKDPTPASVRAICDFFQDIAGLQKILTKAGAIPPNFKARPAFLVLVFCSMNRRRLKRSRNSSGTDFSEVEIWVASGIRLIAEKAHQEIRGEFERLGIAKTCPHCGMLYVDTKLAYCSKRCGDAKRSAKFYNSKRDRLLPMKREEGPAQSRG